MATALATPNIRAGFTTVTPYVWVKDRGLADFVQRVFDAVETSVVDNPGHGIHRELRIGSSMLMIGETGQESSATSPGLDRGTMPLTIGQTSSAPTAKPAMATSTWPDIPEANLETTAVMPPDPRCWDACPWPRSASLSRDYLATV